MPYSYKRSRKAPSTPEVHRPFFDKDGASHAFFQPSEPTIQTKLTISKPGDAYEQEADRVADTVVNQQPSPQVQQKPKEMIHRQTMEKEEEEPVARQAEKEEEKPIQTKAKDSHSTRTRLSQQLKDSRGQGQPLPASTHAEMSNALGYDFSDVTIHTDAQAVRLNQELNAQAFTQGKDIYFNEGKYEPESHSGKHLLAHELTHVVQQSDSKTTVQRELSRDTEIVGESDRREAILQDLESLRPTDPRVGSRFGSTERALRTFQARIPDLNDFISVAESYGLRPGNLLAVFVLEGAFGQEAYWPPLNLETCPETSTRLSDSASLAACHLWQTHGMDDFAVTKRVPCRPRDNVFDVHSRGHRAAMLTSLGNLYSQGMLWNSEGLRPADPRQQLTPGDILSQLTQHVNLSTQLPDEGFIRLAYRIQAATIASRQQLIGRSNVELTQLGYPGAIVRAFRHGAIARERVRVAESHNLFPTSVRTLGERFEWVNRHLRDPEFGRVLMEDDQYRALVRRSFELRMPAAAARITMGTAEGARRAIADANADFRLWARQTEGREAIHRWALDVNVYLIILRGGQTDEARTSQILHEIEAGLNEENLPNRTVRRALQDVMRDLLRDRDYDNMQRLIRFIIDAGNRYSHVDTTRQWIAALAVPHSDTTSIPRALTNYLIPTSRVFRGRIRNVLRIYGESVRYAQGLVEARQELE